MANIKLSIGQIGITQHLLIVLRKTTDPLAEYDRQGFPPPVSSSINFQFTDIDPDEYFIDYRESPDGSALGILLGTFTHDATKDTEVLEMRFYLVGSGVGNAPEPGTNTLTDAYLDGKDFVIYKEGFRPLVPPSATFKEYDVAAGGVITLLNGQVWGEGEVIAVHVVNKVAATPASGGRFADVVDITADITLSSTHYNKRLRCESASSSRLVVTFDDINNVPDGTAFKFMSNRGNQYQTRLLPAAGNVFRYHETNFTEFWLHKGCSFIVEKRIISSVSVWEVYDAPDRILLVGSPLSGLYYVNDPLADIKPRNGALYDGDDWPAIWWVINNRFAPNQVITDDTVINGGYVHPTDKKGLFVKHSTLKKFRVPNSLNQFERNINSLTYGTDGQRLYDYPGGIQNEAVKAAGNSTQSGSTGNPIKAIAAHTGAGGDIDGWEAGGGNAPGSDNFDDIPWPYTGTETRPANEAMIPLIRF